MSTFKITCPGCTANLNLAAAPAPGAKFRCPKCGATFAYPRTSPVSEKPAAPTRPRDDEPQDIQRPARKKLRKKRKAGPGKWLIIGLSVGGGLLAIGLLAGGLVIVWPSVRPVVSPEGGGAPPGGGAAGDAKQMILGNWELATGSPEKPSVEFAERGQERVAVFRKSFDVLPNITKSLKILTDFGMARDFIIFPYQFVGKDQVEFSYDLTSLARKLEGNPLDAKWKPRDTLRVTVSDNELLLTNDQGKTVKYQRAGLAGLGKETASFKLGWRVQSVAFAPDGRTLALGGGVPSPGKKGVSDGLIKLWAMPEGKEVATLLHPGGRDKQFADFRNDIKRLAFLADGKALLAGDAVGYKVWDVATQQELCAPGQGQQGVRAALARDGKTLALAGALGEGMDRKIALALHDPATGRRTAELPWDQPGLIAALEFSPDGKLLAVAWEKGMLLIDLRSRKPVFQAEAQGLLHARFSPDGQLLVAGGNEGAFQVYSVSTAGDEVTVTKRTEPPPPKSGTTSLLFAPNGKTLFAFDTKGLAQLWDVATWQHRTSFDADCVAFAPDGQLLAVGCQDFVEEGKFEPRLKLWQVAEFAAAD